jgi:transcriptional regulator with XRE-family HTH domain
MIELVRPLDQTRESSPLAAARLQRQLTVEEAAGRAGLTPDQVRWLEEGRVYRFATPDDALLAVLLYATSLGIEHREARALANLPVPPKPLEFNSRGRLVTLAGIAAALVALVGAFTLPGRIGGGESEAAAAAEEILPKLPPAWKVSVRVLNGGGDINWTRQVASRIGALAYHIEYVGRADRFDYRQTAVYYPPGGDLYAVRLARQLGVVAKPLPGGKSPRRLVVVVGPRKGPGL